MKAVRQISTGYLIFRAVPNFAEGEGIANAVDLQGIDPSDLEEITCTQVEWDASQEEQMVNKLPHSEHIGKLIAVNPSLAKPAIVRRRYLGENYDVNCLVTQNIVNMWTANPKQINIDDFVLVSFIEEIPNTQEREIAIVTDKVCKSW